MKNLVLFDMALTDEEIQRPIPNSKWLLVTLSVLGAIVVAVIIFRLT